MSRIITVTIFVIAICKCLCTVPETKLKAVEPKHETTDSKTSETNPVILNIDTDVNKTGNATVKNEKETLKDRTQEINIIQPELRTFTEPALHRLFYVLLGLSTITVCYVALKMYRVRKGVARPTHVRKYGVLTQRSDIEMEPLHLDDDEDDDTVFDVGAHANR